MTDLPAADAQDIEALLIQGGMAALFRPGVMARVNELYLAARVAGQVVERNAAVRRRVIPDVPHEVEGRVIASMRPLPSALKLVPTVNTQTARVRIGHAYYR